MPFTENNQWSVFSSLVVAKRVADDDPILLLFFIIHAVLATTIHDNSIDFNNCRRRTKKAFAAKANAYNLKVAELQNAAKNEMIYKLGGLDLVHHFASSCKWPKFTPISLQKYSCSADLSSTKSGYTLSDMIGTVPRISRLVGANFDSLRLRTKNPNTL